MKEYYSPTELVEYLKEKGISISLETVRRAIRQKKLPAVKMGKEYSIHINNIQPWIDSYLV